MTCTDGEETATLDQVIKELAGIGGLCAAIYPTMVDELEWSVLNTYQALRDGQVGMGSLEPEMVMDEINTNDPVQYK